METDNKRGQLRQILREGEAKKKNGSRVQGEGGSRLEEDGGGGKMEECEEDRKKEG